MDVGYVIPSLNRPGWRSTLRDQLNQFLGITQTYDLFEKARQNTNPGDASRDNTFLAVLEETGISMASGDLWDRIPSSGPVIIIANHPFGGADAIALSGLCLRKRKDTRVLANAITAQLPGAADWLIPLQILGENGATRSNRGAMKEALALLRSGGLLVVFPAGAVSHWRSDLGKVADPEWSEHVARLSTKTGAPVLPVRFFGTNPTWFEILGVLHPMIRSALIVRVFLATRGGKIVFRGGEMVESTALKEMPDAKTMTAHLRNTVETIPAP